jgi:hypothetical protein
MFLRCCSTTYFSDVAIGIFIVTVHIFSMLQYMFFNVVLYIFMMLQYFYIPMLHYIVFLYVCDVALEVFRII